jgi:TPR repeat protein/sugar lactone lactonase YvrE
MKKALLIVAVLLPALTFAQGTSQSAQESAIYDSAGKKIFSLVPTGEVEESTDINGVKSVFRLEELTDLETGTKYTYSDRLWQTTSDGMVIMEYHYNKRVWYWVEGQGIKAGDRVRKESIRRTYDTYEDRLNTPEQGERPILRYKEGNFIDEMGRPVYSVRWRGSIPEWVQVILLHKHYEEVYTTEAFEQIKAFREEAAARALESNSLAQDILATGRRNETSVTTLTGNYYRMLYFTEIDGQIIRLNKDQLRTLKNKWLLTNDKAGRAAWGIVIPKAAFRVSRKDAKKRGLGDLESTVVALEIKPAPGFADDFLAAVSQVSAQVEKPAPTPAGTQARVESLSVGILAGSLTSGAGNGYRTDATFGDLVDVAVDSKGNVFVLDGHAIRRISPGGQVSTFAGGPRGYVDGPGITARFASPGGIAIDGSDNLYIADASNRSIRKVSPGGYVSTLAGGTMGYQDGWGPNAKFSSPLGIAVDARGYVYVGDGGNNRKIRKVAPDGTVTTISDVAETGFNNPRSLALDSHGNIFVLDGGAIKRISPDGSIAMMAADKSFNAASDTTSSTLFSNAGGIAVDSNDNLLIAKKMDHSVIRIAATGETAVVARSNSEFWLGRPNAVAIGANGNIYLADRHNRVIHQVTPAGNTGPLPGMHIPKPRTNAPASESKGMSRDERKQLIAATKKRAKADPQAMFELANLYADAGDKIRSLSSFKKAAKKGHAGAQYELALLHLDGTVSYSLTITNGDREAALRNQMARRQVKAAEILAQSANQGYGLAQYALGRAYQNGEGVEQSSDTAIDWYSKAGSQGVYEAQLDLGQIYLQRNTPADYAKAIEWFSMAADQGDAYAMVMSNALLGQTDPNGAGKEINAEAREKLDLGAAYYDGSGGDQDFAAAAELFYESALLGNTTAQWMLGVMSLNGEGMRRDFAQSLDWFTIAADLKNPDAQFYLGRMYERGYGTPGNTPLAYSWYLRAAEQGQLNAQYVLGMLYFDGRSKKAGSQEAREWLEAAAEQGDAHAQYLVAGLYLDDSSDAGNRAQAAKLLEEAASQGHSYAAGQL